MVVVVEAARSEYWSTDMRLAIVEGLLVGVGLDAEGWGGGTVLGGDGAGDCLAVRLRLKVWVLVVEPALGRRLKAGV